MSDPRGWVERLDAETAEWVRTGLVTDAQAAAIRARYATEGTAERSRAGGRFVAIIAGLGAVLLGIGVILFFAANWQTLPARAKVGLALGAIAGTYWAGWRLAFEDGRYPRTGRALLLLGALLYGAGIWLVAQVYHMGGHLPRGLALWIAGILPLAYATRSAPVAGLAAALAVAWFGAAVTEAHEYAVASFVVGTRATFPIYLYAALRFPSQLPQVIAVAVVVLTVSLAVVLAAELGRRRAERRLGALESAV